MPLYRLSYFSIANPKNEDVLGMARLVADQACLENPPLDISGFLIFADNYFLQILEGRRRVLSDLMGRIFADRRHVAVQIASALPISERLFTRMGAAIIESGTERALLLRFSGGEHFNPAEMFPDGHLRLASVLAARTDSGHDPDGAPPPIAR